MGPGPPWSPRAPPKSVQPSLLALTPAGVAWASSLSPPPLVCAAPPPSLCPAPRAVDCAPAQGGGDARRAPGRSSAEPPVPPQRMWRTVCVCVSRKLKGVALGGAAPGAWPWRSAVAARKAPPLRLVRGRPLVPPPGTVGLCGPPVVSWGLRRNHRPASWLLLSPGTSPADSSCRRATLPVSPTLVAVCATAAPLAAVADAPSAPSCIGAVFAILRLVWRIAGSLSPPPPCLLPAGPTHGIWW